MAKERNSPGRQNSICAGVQSCAGVSSDGQVLPESDWRIGATGIGGGSKARKVGRVQIIESTECLTGNLGLKKF